DLGLKQASEFAGMQGFHRIKLSSADTEGLLKLVLAPLSIFDRSARQPVFAALIGSQRQRDQLQIDVEIEFRDGELDLAGHRLRHRATTGVEIGDVDDPNRRTILGRPQRKLTGTYLALLSNADHEVDAT